MVQKIHTRDQDHMVSLGLIRQADSDSPAEGSGVEFANRIENKEIRISPIELPNVLLEPDTIEWCPAVLLAGPERNEWKAQKLIAVEFDAGFSLEEFNEQFAEYGFGCNIVYRTRATKNDTESIVAVLLLNEEITCTKTMDALYEAVIHLFPGAKGSQNQKYGSLPAAGEVLHHEPGETVSARFLLMLGHLVQIGDGDPSERTIRRRVETMSENCTDYIIIESVQKSDIPDPVRRFSYNTARKIRILNAFLNGEKLSVKELLGLATNLLLVSGGLALMDRKISSVGSYSPVHRVVIPYVRRMKFCAFELKSFSPFRQDWVYRDLIQAVKFEDRSIIRKEPYETISLKDGEAEFDAVISRIKETYDEKIHVIKASTGLGKTERYLDWQGVTIALPNHHIISEVTGRMCTWYDRTFPVPELLDERKRKMLARYFKMGASNKARELLHEIQSEVPLHLYSIDPDRINVDDYLYFMKLSHYTNDTLLTTHNTALNINNRNKTYIFDEDPLTTSLLNIEKVYLSDLRELLRVIESKQDRALVQDVLDKMLSAIPNKIYENSMYAFQDYLGLENAVAENRNFKGSVLNFLNANSFVVSSKNQDELSFIMRRNLPANKQVVVLSATAEEWIYKQLYGDRVEFYDISNVEHVGDILQDSTYTFSRSNLERREVLEYAKKVIEDRVVITFKELADEFKNGSNDVYFYKSTGFDGYKGKDIAIVGAPHLDISTYLLYADALGLKFKPRDFVMYERVVERNGLEFKIISFDNPELRNLQLYLIESELRQAGGRARTLRGPGGSVLFLSNYGMPEARQMNEINTQ